MGQGKYAIKGNIYYSVSSTDIAALERGYLLVADGRVAVRRKETL